MNTLHRIYVRIACSLGAIGTGLTLPLHAHHGPEHLGCILLGLVLAFFGLFGFRGKKKEKGNDGSAN